MSRNAPFILSRSIMTRQLLFWILPLALTIGIAACKRQAQKQSSIEPESDSLRLPATQSKLIKTQGSQGADNVNSILEDREGNLWFGTTGEGVYRYDGESFHQFTAGDGLKSNFVYCIFEDQDANIWIGTEAGLCRYDGNRFIPIEIDLPPDLPLNTVWQTRDVFSILQDKNGQLWFATIDGVFTYDGELFTRFPINDGENGFKSSNNNLEKMLEDEAGNIWFGGRVNEGVFRYDGTTITQMKLEALNGHDWAWPALQDQQGDIWFSNWGGTYRYDGESMTTFTKDDGLCSNIVARIVEDRSGNLWFSGGGEDGGICRYDGTSFTHFTTQDGLPDNGVWSIFEDSDGNIWVGTRSTGLCRYDGETFTIYSE